MPQHTPKGQALPALPPDRTNIYIELDRPARSPYWTWRVLVICQGDTESLLVAAGKARELSLATLHAQSSLREFKRTVGWTHL